jgi:hypothetical protein
MSAILHRHYTAAAAIPLKLAPFLRYACGHLVEQRHHWHGKPIGVNRSATNNSTRNVIDDEAVVE